MADLKLSKDSLSEKEISLADLADVNKKLSMAMRLANCEEYCDQLKFFNEENQRKMEAIEMKISEIEITPFEANIRYKATIKTLEDSIAAFKMENMD
jgi:transcription-repair coupling factor (superfamily II helicase)